MNAKPSRRSPLFHWFAVLFAAALYLFIAFVSGLGASQLDYFQDKLAMIKLGLEDAPHEKAFPQEFHEGLHSWTDDPARVHTQWLLTAAAYKNNPALLLVDREGNIRHHWNVDNIYTNQEVVRRHRVENPSQGGISAIDDAVVFPNGDVIALQDNRMLPNYRGQRLFRMDKNSVIRWETPGAFHHEFDLGSDGHLYALDYELRDRFPLIDHHRKQSVTFLLDTIVKLSPEDGRVLDRLSIPDAFVGTPFELYLYGFELNIPTLQEFTFAEDGRRAFDPIHTNSVQYIDDELAAMLPFAQAGDLLISMRGPCTLAILRPATRKIVWAAAGPWRHQHHARLLPNGVIRLFDNEGASVFVDDEDGEIRKVYKSRILDYDPVSGHVKIRYFDPLYRDTWTFWRGTYQELKDGSLLFTSTAQSRVLQISPEGEVIWELRGLPDRDYHGAAYRQRIMFAKAYDPQYFSFIDPTPDPMAAPAP